MALTLTQPQQVQVILQFEPTESGALIYWDSLMGQFKSKFKSPYTTQKLRIVIKALDAAQYPDHPYSGPSFSIEEQALLTDLSLWKDGCVPSNAHKIVGQELYRALIEDREGERALTNIREHARSQGNPLSYVLRFPQNSIELASLPWESLWDNRQAVLLSRGTRDVDSFERYLNMNEALSPPLPVGQTLRILALSPQAGITPEVRDAERAARLKSWDVLKAKGLLIYDELTSVTMTELNNRLRNGPRPDIIHYYGHGTYKNGGGYLLFDQPELPRQREWVSANRLSAQLGGIRLIMIHACQSAMIDDSESQGDLLTGIAPALSAISEAVVAMQLTIRISAATRFSEVFYEEIARGRSLQIAVAEARRALYVAEDDGASWYVPTLYIRARDQKPLYLIKQDGIELENKNLKSSVTQRLHPQSNSSLKENAEPSRAKPDMPSQQVSQDLDSKFEQEGQQLENYRFRLVNTIDVREVNRFQFCKNGDILFGINKEKYHIQVWLTDDWSSYSNITENKNGSIQNMAISQNGRRIAIISRGSLLRIYDVEKSSIINEANNGIINSCTLILFKDDELIICSSEGVIYGWKYEIDQFSDIYIRYRNPRILRALGYSSGGRFMAFAEGGNLIVIDTLTDDDANVGLLRMSIGSKTLSEVQFKGRKLHLLYRNDDVWFFKLGSEILSLENVPLDLQHEEIDDVMLGDKPLFYPSISKYTKEVYNGRGTSTHYSLVVSFNSSRNDEIVLENSGWLESQLEYCLNKGLILYTPARGKVKIWKLELFTKIRNNE